MLEEQQKRIHSCLNILVKNMDCEYIVDFLLKELVFNQDDFETISDQNTTSGKTRKMLIILMQKKTDKDYNDPYNTFILAMKENNYGHLAKIVEEADTSEVDDKKLKLELTPEQKIEYMMKEMQTMTSKLNNLYNVSVNSNHNPPSNIVLEDDCQNIKIDDPVLINFIQRLMPVGKAFVGPKNGQTDLINESGNNQVVRNHRVSLSGDSPDFMDKDFQDDSVPNIYQHFGKKFVYLSSIEAKSCEIGQDLLLNNDLSIAHSDIVIANVRVFVMQTIDKNRVMLSESIDKLYITELDQGYPAVGKIADELFNDINWGRIIAWYAFWRVFVIKLPGGNGNVDEEENTRYILGNYIGYILSKKCSSWISDKGGWMNLLTLAEKKRCSIL